MEIKKVGKTSFSLKGAKAKLLINPNEKGVQLSKIRPQITVSLDGGHVSKEGVYSIESPGEYEIDEVYCMYREVNGGKLLFVDIDDVHICYLDNGIKVLRKNVLDQLSSVNIIIAQIDEETGLSGKILWGISNEISPGIVIPFTDSEDDLERFKSTFGSKSYEELPKLRVRQEDFNKGEASISVVILQTGGSKE